MMTVDRDNWRRFVDSPMVLADHGSEGGGRQVYQYYGHGDLMLRTRHEA